LENGCCADILIVPSESNSVKWGSGGLNTFMSATKVRHVRLTLSPFTSEQMLGLGRVGVKSIQDRIHSGKNARDESSKALKGVSKPGNWIPYAEQKLKKGLQGIRDWFKSGRTLSAMMVLSANENGGKIGFNNSHSNPVAVYLDKIEKTFSFSPDDQKKMEAELVRMLTAKDPVRVEIQ
jgi:hypothetical protein